MDLVILWVLIILEHRKAYRVQPSRLTVPEALAHSTPSSLWDLSSVLLPNRLGLSADNSVVLAALHLPSHFIPTATLQVGSSVIPIL
jgi:hypothetical protein